jgi:hypothetical protein
MITKCTRCGQNVDIDKAVDVHIDAKIGNRLIERVVLPTLHPACATLRASARQRALNSTYRRQPALTVTVTQLELSPEL